MAEGATGGTISGDLFTTRPVVLGRRGVITSGHYLASAAGMRIYERGGNAVDAAAAAGLGVGHLRQKAPDRQGAAGGGNHAPSCTSDRDFSQFLAWQPTRCETCADSTKVASATIARLSRPARPPGTRVSERALLFLN